MTVIREMASGDAVEVTSLWQVMARETGLTDFDSDTWLAMTRAALQCGVGLGVVAVENGRIAGFADALLLYEPATRDLIMSGKTLYVLKEHRGACLGDRMMVQLLLLGKQSGATALVTHGTPTVRAVEKVLGRQMEPYQQFRILRW